MFGTYRFVLALIVVGLHLAALPWLGIYAVFGFYLLSGYLMTYVLHDVYGHDRRGVARYLANRFLRIYPLYWVSMAASLALIAIFGGRAAAEFFGGMRLPASLGEWLANLCLVFSGGLQPYDGAILTPTAWALTIELTFYVVLALGAARTRRRAWLFFAAAVAWHALTVLTGRGLIFRYFLIPAGALPFAAGALVFLHREAISRRLAVLPGARWHPALAVLAALINWRVAMAMGWADGLGFYLSIACSAGVVATFSRVQSLAGISRRLDGFLGDLSYSIFLIHFQVGFVVHQVLAAAGLSVSRPSWLLFSIAVPVVLLVATAMAVAVQRPLDRLRDSVRGRATRSEPSVTRRVPGAADAD